MDLTTEHTEWRLPNGRYVKVFASYFIDPDHPLADESGKVVVASTNTAIDLAGATRLGVGEIDHYSRQAESAFAEAMAAVGAIADAQKATKIATARAALADAGLPEAAINALMALNGQL